MNRKSYYGDVSVEISEDLNAEFNGTTLSLKLPVTSIPKETLEKEVIFKSIPNSNLFFF